MKNSWNLWHGCKKYSEGCANCYVYRGDAKYDRDAEKVFKTKSFSLPIQKNKKGVYKLKSGVVWTCFSSDFLLDSADEWRKEAWRMIKERSDCTFIFITKRISRFQQCVPADWGEGYDNVVIGVTCENQRTANERLPIFLKLPIKHKFIMCEPLLEKIELNNFLDAQIEGVIVGGETGSNARFCNYDWVLHIRECCVKHDVAFIFKQTGAKFIKNGKIFYIQRKYQHVQAKKASINFKNFDNFEI